MKKIRKMICIATITLMACFACTACGTTYQEAVSEEYATDDSICGNYIIVSGYKFGITPLYNADGTLQVYEE